jgi:hypothetical protein
MLHGQAAYGATVRWYSAAFQCWEQESLFFTVVAVIGKRAQEYQDTLRERNIHRFSILKPLCRKRHTGHRLLMLAEGHLTRGRFVAMLRRIALLPLPAS